MRRIYRYVGPRKIADRVLGAPLGVRVESPNDILRWIRDTGQELDAGGCVIATFVIDDAGWLRIADRRSEHVACAGGGAVCSAGEMTFAASRDRVGVSWVTNQSAGYCPEIESWPAVQAALTKAGIAAPDGFSKAHCFRRCVPCGSINIIKDGVFECSVCAANLPADWNLECEIAAERTAATESGRHSPPLRHGAAGHMMSE